MAALKTNTLYKLDNGDFTVIFHDAGSAQPDFAVYQHTPYSEAKFTLIDHELASHAQPFAQRFNERIAQSGGSLKPASEKELSAILNDAKLNHPNQAEAAKIYEAAGKSGQAVKLSALEDPYTHINNMSKLSAGEQLPLGEEFVSQLTNSSTGHAVPSVADFHRVAGTTESIDRGAKNSSAPLFSEVEKIESEAVELASKSKLLNKKTLAITGAVVAFGAVAYAAQKLLDRNKTSSPEDGPSI